MTERIERAKQQEEVVQVDVSESEFRGYMEEQREQYQRRALEAQMGILGTVAALRKVDFAQHIGKRVKFYKKMYKDPLGNDMVQYGAKFGEKSEFGFKFPNERKEDES